MAINNGGSGLGGSLGGNFEINVTGNAEAELNKITEAFKTVKDASGNQALAVSDSANSMNLLIQAGWGLEEIGHQMSNLGKTIIHGLVYPVEMAMQGMARLEALTIGMKSAFRELDNKAFDDLSNRIERIAIISPFAQTEVMELVTSLKNVAGVDLSQQFKGVKGFAQSGIEFLTDLAAGAGRSINDVAFSVRQLISSTPGSKEAFTSFKRRLHLGGKDQMTEALKQAGQKADFSTHLSTLDTLFKYTSIKFGGLTKEITKSYTGMMSNIKDALTIGLKNMGGGYFERMKGILAKFLDYLNIYWDKNTVKGSKFIGAMSTVFSTLGDMVGWVADRLIGLIYVVTEFASQNPLLFKTIYLLGGLAGAFLLTVGPMVTFLGFMAKTVGSLSGLGGASRLGMALLRNFGVGLYILSVSMLAMIGIPALIYGAYKTNFAGFADLVDKTVLVIKGLFALISSNKGEFGWISKELKQTLEEAGLWEFTVKAFMIFGRLKQFLDGFFEGIQVGWYMVSDALEIAIKAMMPLFKSLAYLVGMDVTEASESSAASWLELGKTLGAIAGVTIPALIIGFTGLTAATWAYAAAMFAANVTNPLAWIAVGIAALFTLYQHAEKFIDLWKFSGLENMPWIKAISNFNDNLQNSWLFRPIIDPALITGQASSSGQMDSLSASSSAPLPPDIAALVRKPGAPNASKEPFNINLYLDGSQIHSALIDQDKAQSQREYH